MNADTLRLYEVLACYTALAITPSLAALASVLGWRAGKLHYELGELAHARLIEWRDGRRRVLRVTPAPTGPIPEAGTGSGTEQVRVGGV